jgi:predicted phosphodiesterase
MKELFEKFKQLSITTRSELRDRIDELLEEGLNQQIIEGYFSEYKKLDAEATEEKQLKVITINDLHVPYHNKVMVQNYIKFISDEQPDQIILKGDMVDFYDLSSFDKNPEREGKLQEELDILKGILRQFRRACPSAKIVYIMGNHEDRLRRYLWKNAKALNSLRALKFEELLSLKQLKIDVLEDSYFISGFEFSHGDVVRQYSSYSAKAEYDKRNNSGCSGHTHRMGSYCKTTTNGTFGWWEDGCACDLSTEYIKGTPNWQNGFSVVYFDGNAYDVHQVYVHKGHFRFNGVKY